MPAFWGVKSLLSQQAPPPPVLCSLLEGREAVLGGGCGGRPLGATPPRMLLLWAGAFFPEKEKRVPHRLKGLLGGVDGRQACACVCVCVAVCMHVCAWVWVSGFCKAPGTRTAVCLGLRNRESVRGPRWWRWARRRLGAE